MSKKTVNRTEKDVSSDKQISLEKLEKFPGLIESEHYLSKYVPAFSQIQSPRLENLREVLRENDFVCDAKPETQSILKICTKSTWESLTYRVKVGNIEKEINVFRMTTHSRSYTPKSMAKGSFGKVSHIRHGGTDYVLKSILLDSGEGQQLSVALREVFMVKLASCLGVGPHFGSIYGYDALLFRDCLQFVMEMCATTFDEDQIRDELKNKNLLRSLKILHTLGICHSDIKVENIGLSGRLNRFVFLDFGFAKYVHEPLGFKTLTKFQGTFKYTSDQMKKAYMLRNSVYVDLYYNDLHGLQKSLAELEKILIVKDNFFPLSLNSEDSTVDLDQQSQEEYQDLIPFFQLKFFLFKQDYGQAAIILESQRKLIYTFRKILYDSAKEGKDYKFPEGLLIVYEKYVKFCDELQKLNTKIRKNDAFLCNYLLQISSEDSVAYIERLREMAQRENCLSFIKETWEREDWMEELFYFLSDDASFRQRVIPAKNRNILADLFAFVRQSVSLRKDSPLKRLPLKSCSPDPASMLHDVMVMFFDYFHQQRKPAILELIQPYFIVFGDEYNSEQMEMLILGLYESDDRAYVAKNLEFLVGKRLTILGYEWRIESSNNLENVKRVYQRLQQTLLSTPHQLSKQQEDLIQYISQTIIIMKNLNTQNSTRDQTLVQLLQKNQHQICKYAKKWKSWLSEQICYFLDNFFQFVLEIKFTSNPAIRNSFSAPKFKNRYLTTNYIKLQQIRLVMLNLKDNETYQIGKYFWQFYFPFNEDYLNYVSQKQITPAIIQFYQQVRLNHNFGLTQLQILILAQMSAPSYQNLQQFLNSYFNNTPLHQLTSIVHLSHILNSFTRVLCTFTDQCPNKEEFMRKLRRKLAKNAQEFLDWTQYFFRALVEEEGGQLEGKKKFLESYRILEGIVMIKLEEYDRAGLHFLKMFDFKRTNCALIHYLCEIYNSQSLSPQVKDKISTQLSQISLHQFQKNKQFLQVFLSASIISPTILKSKQQKVPKSQTLSFLLTVLQLHNHQHIYFINSNVKPLIDSYLPYQSMGEIRELFQYILGHYTVGSVRQFPGVSVLMFQVILVGGFLGAGHKQEEGNGQERQKVGKGLLYCAFGFDRIQNNSIVWIKKYLSYQIACFYGFQKKKYALKKAVHFSKDTLNYYKCKFLKKIDKKKTPEKVKHKLQLNLIKILDCYEMKTTPIPMPIQPNETKSIKVQFF